MNWPGQMTIPEPTRSTPPPTESGPRPGAQSIPGERREKMEMTNVANIGKSLHINGELTGDEDLTVEGSVEGKITLNGHSVTIGANGRVTGEIRAKSVLVAGQVKGNITAEERTEVAATGHVLGDVLAPRVSVADGARFKGSIDTDADSVPGSRVTTTAASGLAGSPNPHRTDTPSPVAASKS